MSTKVLECGLTVAELDQLAAMVESCTTEGWYYGNREQFYQRTRNIAIWLVKQRQNQGV